MKEINKIGEIITTLERFRQNEIGEVKTLEKIKEYAIEGLDNLETEYYVSLEAKNGD